MSHQDVNREYWAGQAADYAESARRDWAAPEPHWGIWKLPEAAEAMGTNFMDRRRAPEALAAGYAQGRALAG